MKKISKFLLPIFVFSLLVWVFPFMSQAAGQAAFSFSPTTKSVTAGESFTVTVFVSPNGEELDTARAVVNFSAAYLEATNFSLGSLFPNQSPGNSINNTAGVISQGGYTVEDAITQSGNFGTITFKARYNGTATISVGSNSRLISVGEEKIDTASSGTATVTVSGGEEPPAVPEPPAEPAAPAAPAVELSAEQEAIGAFGLIYGRLPSTSEEWTFIQYAAYGHTPAVQNQNAEVYAVDKFISVYSSLPASDSDWNVVKAIAYSGVDEVPAAPAAPEAPAAPAEPAVELTVEQQAVGTFGLIYGRLPSTSEEWTFVQYAAYGHTPAVQDQNAEVYAVDKFISTYNSLPATDSDWNIVKAIAYSGAEEVPAAPAAPEAPAEPEAPAVELTPEQEAIGDFGLIYGRLPSTSEEWTFIQYTTYGHTPAVQDQSAEVYAVDKFISVYNSLPATDSDWNIVKAIAYSGAEEVPAAEVPEEGVVAVEGSNVQINETGTGWLRVRSNPYIQNDPTNEITKVNTGESFPYVETQGDWYKIEYESGKYGWVYSDYASLVE